MKEARLYDKVKTVSSINGVGKIEQVSAKTNETRPPTYIIHKNTLKKGNRLK